jgi:hypothetical protein
MSEADIATARLQAAAARERLIGSAHELQVRLSPGTLAENAWDGLRDKGEAAAETAVETARKHPVATGAAVAGVAALIARKPIGRLIARLRGKDDGDEE